jgi:RHS repeat-associated protein
VNGETKKFGYDGNDLILEMNGQDSILANYTHGPAGVDDPLMMNRAGKNYYYAKDGLGSVTALTDSTGSIVHEYKYSVFGKIVEETGVSVENPFTYTSREMDWETGLMYYRARYYDPGLGRFLSEDPIGLSGGDANFYRYVGNNPISKTDPNGLYWRQALIGGIKGAALGSLSAAIISSSMGGKNIGAAVWNGAWTGAIAGAAGEYINPHLASALAAAVGNIAGQVAESGKPFSQINWQYKNGDIRYDKALLAAVFAAGGSSLGSSLGKEAGNELIGEFLGSIAGDAAGNLFENFLSIFDAYGATIPNSTPCGK